MSDFSKFLRIASTELLEAQAQPPSLLVCRLCPPISGAVACITERPSESMVE